MIYNCDRTLDYSRAKISKPCVWQDAQKSPQLYVMNKLIGMHEHKRMALYLFVCRVGIFSDWDGLPHNIVHGFSEWNWSSATTPKENESRGTKVTFRVNSVHSLVRDQVLESPSNEFKSYMNKAEWASICEEKRKR